VKISEFVAKKEIYGNFTRTNLIVYTYNVNVHNEKKRFFENIGGFAFLEYELT
jgi:hypothetical protein